MADLGRQCVTFVSIYVFGLLFTRPGVQPRHATEASTYPSKPVIPMYENGQREHENRSNVNPATEKPDHGLTPGSALFRVNDRVVQDTQMVEILFFHQRGMGRAPIGVYPTLPPATPLRTSRSGLMHLPRNINIQCHCYAPFMRYRQYHARFVPSQNSLSSPQLRRQGLEMKRAHT